MLSETYYVAPSTNTCPFESCLTLSHIAALLQNESMESDVSLVFLPGNHTLDIPLLVENANSFRMEMIGNYSDDTKIECNHEKGFNFEIGNVTDVYISGLQFIGCSTSLHLTRQVWITGYTFSFSKKTALVFSKSSAYITESLFGYNQGGSYQLELKSLAGGAIFEN